MNYNYFILYFNIYWTLLKYGCLVYTTVISFFEIKTIAPFFLRYFSAFRFFHEMFYLVYVMAKQMKFYECRLQRHMIKF